MQLSQGNHAVVTRESCSCQKGVIQLSQGSHAVVTRESCSCHKGIMQLSQGNHAVVTRESCSCHKGVKELSHDGIPYLYTVLHSLDSICAMLTLYWGLTSSHDFHVTVSLLSALS